MLLKCSGLIAENDSTVVMTGTGKLLDGDLVVDAATEVQVYIYDSDSVSNTTNLLAAMSVAAAAGNADHFSTVEGIPFSKGLMVVVSDTDAATVIRYNEIKLS